MSDLDFSRSDEPSTHSASGALRDYRVWRRNFRSCSFAQYLEQNPDLGSNVVIELASADLIQQITAGNDVRAEDYIAAIAKDSISIDLMLDLVDAEICVKSDRGEVVDRKEFVTRFPDLKAELSSLFDIHEIDLEASKSHGQIELNKAPISIPGIELVRQSDEGSATEIAGQRFELWEAMRIHDQSPLHLILWNAGSEPNDNPVDSLLNERRSVSHSSLLQPIEFGGVDSWRYVVTRRLEGKTLGRLINQTDEDKLTGKTIAELLLAVHEARDHMKKSLGVAIPITNGGIFVQENGTPILIDFPGFAGAENANPLLQLGLLLFATCLQDSDVTEVEQHLDAGYEPIALDQINAAVSPELNSIYLSCVHPDATRRYKSIDDALADLQRFISGKAVKPASKRRRWFGF